MFTKGSNAIPRVEMAKNGRPGSECLKAGQTGTGTASHCGSRTAALTAYRLYAGEVGQLQCPPHRLIGHLHDTTLRDPLTGILNRRGLDKVLALRFADSRRLSILMVDVDHFKEVNDTFGHPAGDEVLAGLAGCMVTATRGGDSIGRYGGDEFLIVLPGAESRTAGELADRTSTRLSQWNVGRPFPVHISRGIAEKGESLTSPELLIEAADRALYQAKETGRGLQLSSEKMNGAPERCSD